MKTIATCWILVLLSNVFALAQSRFSVAPTYWFNHGIYNYRVRLLSDPVVGISDYSGHSNNSSIGLTARYHFGEKWSISVGALYNKSVSHLNTPQMADVRLENEYIQLPVVLNYRLTTHRLSPYFSTGVSLDKNKSIAQDKFKASALVGVGLDYRISSKFSLLVQPIASYLLYKPADSELIKYDKFNSYKVGIQTQAIWHF